MQLFTPNKSDTTLWQWYSLLSNFLRGSIAAFSIPNLPIFANNAAAKAGGLIVGDLYRTGADPDPVCIVH